MYKLLTACVSLILGIAILVWSADKFVAGAASLARNLGMSPLLIGLTVVSLGTSAPELLVSTTAAMVGSSGIAIGNAIGSNIANIGLVLGITALFVPLPIRSKLLRKELPILVVVTIFSGLLLYDASLSRVDGGLLIIALVITLYLFAHYQPSEDDSALLVEEEEELPHLSMTASVIWFMLGLTLLVASSRLLVWAATFIAQQLGVSDLIIGLTIIAIGTSLPELAASVASALKGHHDIAIGNVIGSNIFNLLAVMSVPAVISPYSFEQELIWRDYGLMCALTGLLVFFCYFSIKGNSQVKLGRATGSLFVLIYCAYLAGLFIEA